MCFTHWEKGEAVQSGLTGCVKNTAGSELGNDRDRKLVYFTYLRDKINLLRGMK